MTQEGNNGQQTGQSAAPGKVTQGFGVVTLERSNEMAAVAVAAAAKAEVEAAYVMALKQPRNEDDARVKIIAICKNPSFAAKSRYSKPVGGSAIEGPSIRLAEEILRHWGNVLVQQTAIYDDDAKRIVKVTVRDLESNLSYSKELTVEKHVERKNPTGRDVLGERPNTTGSRVFIVKATEDELQNKEAALVSKAIRNNGLRLIPEHIIEEAMRTAKDTMAAKVKMDPEAEKKAVLDGFASIGVMPSDLEGYLQHPLAQVTAQELLDLREIYTAIKDGQAVWGDYATAGGPAKPAEQPAEKQTGLKDRLKTQASTGGISDSDWYDLIESWERDHRGVLASVKDKMGVEMAGALTGEARSQFKLTMGDYINRSAKKK